MAATLKTDVVGNKTDSTANLTLGSSGATTFGGAVDINSGAIDGTTVGAASASTGGFTNVTATNIQATSGQTLSLKEDSGTAVITVPTDGSIELLPASTTSVTLGKNSTNAIVPSTGHGQDRHTGESVELNAKVTGVGYRSGSTSSSTAKSVGAMYAGITGEIKMFGGQYEPEGWVFCDGSAYDGGSSTAYKNLYDVITTTYGDGGGGSNMFNVPDMRGRVPAGMDDMDSAQGLAANGSGSTGDGGGDAARLTTGTLGATGGAESETISASHMPVHSHTNTHGHGDDLALASGSVSLTSLSFKMLRHNAAEVDGQYPMMRDSGTPGPSTRTLVGVSGGGTVGTTLSGDVTDYTGNTGNVVGGSGGTAYSKLQPYLCINYIIKL